MPKKWFCLGHKGSEARTAEAVPPVKPCEVRMAPDAVGSVIIQWTAPAYRRSVGVGVLFDSDEVVIAERAVDPTDDYVVPGSVYTANGVC